MNNKIVAYVNLDTIVRGKKIDKIYQFYSPKGIEYFDKLDLSIFKLFVCLSFCPSFSPTCIKWSKISDT